MRITIKNKGQFIVLILVFFFLGNYSSAFYLYSALALLLIKMVIDDEEHNFYLACFLVPFIRVFDRLGVTYIVNLLFVVPLVIGVVKKKIKIDGLSTIACIGFFMIELLHVIAFGNYSTIMPTTASIATLLYGLCIINNQIDIKTSGITDYLCMGVLSSAGIYLLCNPAYAARIVSNVLGNQRFAGFAGEPNYYSLYICLSLSLVFALDEHSIRHYIYIFLLSAIGLFTASKMCLFLMGFIIVGGLLYSAFALHESKRFRFFAITLAGLFIVGLFFNNQVIRLLDNIIKRMNISNGRFSLAAASTGRLDILNDYMEICAHDPKLYLLGYGTTYHINLNQQFGAHNTYLDILFAWGVFVALLLFLLWVYTIRRGNRKDIKKSVICYFPAVILGINLFDLSCFSAGMFWLVVTIAFIPAIFGNKEAYNPIYEGEE